MENNNLMDINKELQNIEDTKNDIKIFLINQAKRELKRIISLTNTLDNLQDKYQEKVTEFIDDNQNNNQMMVECLPEFIKVITSCLERSENIIKQVMTDKTLNNINVNMLTQINNNNTTSLELEDAQSRSKVREIVKTLLSTIEETEIEDL